MEQTNKISLGSHVVLRKKAALRCIKLTQPKQEGCIEKLKFSYENAIGQPLGSSFIVKNRKLERCNPLIEQELLGVGTVGDNNVGETLSGERDNREIVDDCGAAQQMHMDVINDMKERGERGAALVNQLVENSSTFTSKNALTQQKYVRRKMRKHGDVISICRPSLRLMAEICHFKDAEKVGNLRPDTLSMILGYGNIRAGINALVLDHCAGLVSAAVLDRLGGFGSCVHLHKGPRAQAIPAIENMDFTPKALEAFRPIPISIFFDGLGDFDFTGHYRHSPHEDTANIGEVLENGCSESNANVSPGDQPSQIPLTTEQCGHLEFYHQTMFDCLILAAPLYHMLPLLDYYLPKVALSRPVILYHMHLQPLVECYKFLKDSGKLINLTLVDSLYRHYQVLPERTHPEMTQSVAGGYILYGFTVDDLIIG